MDFGGLFGAVGNVISTAMTNRANKKMTARTNNMQKQLADEAWARETAYNAPSAQMQRYRAAGLNPHLIYGQNDNGYQYQTPDLETPQSVAADMSSLSDFGIGSFQDIRTRRLQNDILDEELKQKVIDTDYKIENSQLDVEVKRLLKKKTAREILGLDFANKIQENNVHMIPIRNFREQLENKKVRQEIENCIKSLHLQERSINASTFTNELIRNLVKKFLGANSASSQDISDAVDNAVHEIIGNMNILFDVGERISDKIKEFLEQHQYFHYSTGNTDHGGADF